MCVLWLPFFTPSREGHTTDLRALRRRASRRAGVRVGDLRSDRVTYGDELQSSIYL